MVGEIDSIIGAISSDGLGDGQDCDDTFVRYDQGVTSEHSARRFNWNDPSGANDSALRIRGGIHGISIQKKALPKQGFYELRLAYGFAAGLASGFAAGAAGLASGFASGFGVTIRVPTTSTVTRRFGARQSMSCLRFILLSQNLVTGIGCFGPLPSQKITF